MKICIEFQPFKNLYLPKKQKNKAIIQTFQTLNENENENKEDWRTPPPNKDTKQWLHDVEPATQEAEPQVESEPETETQGGGYLRGGNRRWV